MDDIALLLHPTRFKGAESLQLQGAPTIRQSWQHAHRLDGLGMSQRCANLGHGLDICLICFLGELARQHVRDQSAANEQCGGDGSDKAEKRMQKRKGRRGRSVTRPRRGAR